MASEQRRAGGGKQKRVPGGPARGTKPAETGRDTYHAAVIWTDGTCTSWRLERVTAAQAAGNVRKLAESDEAKDQILIATICREGTRQPQRVTLPGTDRTVHWAACGQYDVTAIDGRIYAIDQDGEPYVDLLDGDGETYIEHDRPGSGCGMTERCEAAAGACAAHAGITAARHVFDRI